MESRCVEGREDFALYALVVVHSLLHPGRGRSKYRYISLMRSIFFSLLFIYLRTIFNDICLHLLRNRFAILFFLFHFPLQVNKRFVTSYLNVQGKLYTKIG